MGIYIGLTCYVNKPIKTRNGIITDCQHSKHNPLRHNLLWTNMAFVAARRGCKKNIGSKMQCFSTFLYSLFKLRIFIGCNSSHYIRKYIILLRLFSNVHLLITFNVKDVFEIVENDPVRISELFWCNSYANDLTRKYIICMKPTIAFLCSDKHVYKVCYIMRDS